ncbi:MAG: LptE family protein [Bacteroidia bacterium]
MKIIKLTSISVILIFTTLFFESCKISYSFTGASISPDIKTVSIKTFQNNAPLAQPTLSQSFTESLKDIFITQTNLTLIEKGGDLQFEGKITGYNVTPVAIQGNQVSTASLNRLTITVLVKFINTKDEKQNFEQSFSRFADFDASKNLASVENELIKDINSQLSQDIFNRAVTNW